MAVRLNERGTTVVTVQVSPTGAVLDATVKSSSGYKDLDAATIQCVETLGFQPATQNGIPVKGSADITVSYKIEGRDVGPPIGATRAPGPPAGWEVEEVPPLSIGIFASYKVAQAPDGDEFLSAAAYKKSDDLDGFVAKNDAGLQSVGGLKVLREQRATICGGQPASIIEYSQAGLLAAEPNRILDVEQVRTFADSAAVIATYIRPADAPKRADAEEWIRNFCASR